MLLDLITRRLFKDGLSCWSNESVTRPLYVIQIFHFYTFHYTKVAKTSLCFCTEKKDVAKNVYEVDQELGGGELSPSVRPEVGNRPPQKKNLANARSRGIVTSQIEPCIICIEL